MTHIFLILLASNMYYKTSRVLVIMKLTLPTVLVLDYYLRNLTCNHSSHGSAHLS